MTISTKPAGDGLRRRRNSPPPPKSEPATPTHDDPSAKLKPSHPYSSFLTVHVTWVDWLICAFLLLGALAVRFYRLAKLDVVIFDEVHYLNFGTFLLSNKYFFDVNPVFGKMAIAYVGKLMGLAPLPRFTALGEHVPAAQAFAARAPAALFGAFTVPIFYRVCRLLRLSMYASVLGALFILFDMMHVIQSRIAMVDSVLVFFTCVAFYSALLLWDAKNVVVIKGRSVSMLDTAYVLLYLVLTGICCGLCVSVRWTAFATPALIFTVSLYGVNPFCKEPLNVLELAVLYGTAVASYMGSFALFLLNVNESGPGDGFMSAEFQKCLVGSKHWEGGEGCGMSMWARIIEVNRVIFQYSKGIRGKDKWGSSWFQWIVNWRGALYHREVVGEGAEEKVSLIYMLMNPVMTLCIDVLMLVFIGALFYTVRYRKELRTTEALKEHLRRGGALFFAWVGSMLPTMVVYRSGPVYQYLPGLFFAQALGALGFDLIPRRMRGMAFAIIAAGIVGAYVYWGVWVYGLPLPHTEHVKRRWLPRWD
ncbi:Dolichyl-phosphate-mannose--protein mannosyltransferase, family GT39 [Chondrus crispus]|uniref:Dolichyl-phosphate-mannose--protein mannosyltransferase, family GT39 n=1 Tax=Chondrus crispus TaxID=2769 RepID=R7QBJ0_CHOCR|nr:Dolichyl-phosphate-mannose--protein mannosyltransferase, family GT39 [Chondrus crispus]CDF35143.1 Dolichyl-phosphate-mannose--protein mannosyltransferase, family GT39 [Chondrus crispus]|eukprot:XP_005714962.1 Dolichyl-phosphate-mannose--protein mannosyltransferase, family GT39 [Chondrus crispus]